MECIGTLKSYIEAPKFVRVTNTLRQVKFHTDTELTITAHEKGWIKEIVYFTFRGEESQLKNVQVMLENAILNYKTSGFTSDKYKIKSLDISNNDEHRLNMKLQTSKFSSVKDLPKKIAESMDVPVNIKEIKNGFFKGKIISVNTLGTPKEMQSFKKLMESHLTIKLQNGAVKKLKFKLDSLEIFISNDDNFKNIYFAHNNI